MAETKTIMKGELTISPSAFNTLVKLKEEELERWEEHTSELQSLAYLVCRLLLEKKNNNNNTQQ